MTKMSAKLYHLEEHHPLTGSNTALLLAGALILSLLLWWTLDPEIPPVWYLVALKLQLAALVGLFLRGLRRRVFFGRALSLHQSLSFEVVVQILQSVSPLLPRKAFEAEFIIRETGLPRALAQAWIRSRGTSVWLIGVAALGAILWGHALPVAASLCALALAGGFLYSLLSLRRTTGADTVVVSGSRHAANLAMGLLTWGFEGALFVWALSGILPPAQAMLIYVGFTAIVELSPVPYGLGVAELPALIAALSGHAPAALAALLIFHLARLWPLLPLGILYLARYKLRLADFQDAGIIGRITRSHRPAGGWALAEDGAGTDAGLVTLVIPAYNEEQRLPAYLDAIRAHLDGGALRVEVLIVDDGSKDGTAAYVERVAAIDPRVRLVRQPRNEGKGNAVKRGVLEARGRYVLFADADGATPITELEGLLGAVGERAEIAIGSRRLAAARIRRERTGLRQLMGNVFYSVVNFFAVPGIRDTQCGFKLFRTDVARELFRDLNESGWAFDVELLYRAQLFGYGIAEVPVNWHEVPGSKVDPLRDAVKMFLAIFRIRRRNAGLLRHAPSGQVGAAAQR
ncbi:MAG: glycosyltransferase family 2 protein [Sphingobacteriia bacterium]|nr:glycosyltransferase family 2 protein [Sphingobacteriia bacterium]NCC40514.1 glycosyltransferase family 2 protein [Gammaproteobacteria bacterium]